MMKNNRLYKGKEPWGMYMRIWTGPEVGTPFAFLTNSE
jgi:hypothetical protein